jgi:AcrR family transcriptional regulator
MAKASTRRYQGVADDILASAAVLFDTKGYGQTSLQDIADVVGIARPSLYHYFDSKEAILATLVDRATARREEIIAEIEGTDDSPLVRLRSLLRLVGEATGSNPAGLRLALDNERALPEAVRHRSARSRRMLFELLAAVLRDGVEAGSLRPVDEHQVAATVIAALTGLQYREIGGVAMSPQQAAGLLEELIVFGISQPSDRQASNLDEALALVQEDLLLVERHARSSAAGQRRRGGKS